VSTSVVAISQERFFGFVKDKVLHGQRSGIVFPDIEFVEAEIKLSAARLVQKLVIQPIQEVII
jgi:hypothetical protein